MAMGISRNAGYHASLLRQKQSISTCMILRIIIQYCLEVYSMFYCAQRDIRVKMRHIRRYDGFGGKIVNVHTGDLRKTAVVLM